MASEDIKHQLITIPTYKTCNTPSNQTISTRTKTRHHINFFQVIPFLQDLERLKKDNNSLKTELQNVKTLVHGERG